MIGKALGLLREVQHLPAYHQAMRGYGVLTEYNRLSYGNHARQYVLHRPAITPKAPVLVWFHGGGWQFGAPDGLLGFGEYFSARGYEVYLVSHRRLPRFGGSLLLDDAFAALRLVDANTATNTPLLLGGISSGGHLASLVAFRQNEWANKLKIGGLLLGAAPLSLRHLGWSPQIQRLAGRRRDAAFDVLDPIASLREVPNFPALQIHGTRDGLVPYASSVAFAEHAASIGWHDFELHTLPGGTHLDAGEWVWDV